MKTLEQIIEYVGEKERYSTILAVLSKCDKDWVENFTNRVISGENSYTLAKEIIPVAGALNLHEYTLGLCLLLLIAQKSQKLYQEKGLKEEFFLWALDDIKCKILETMTWHNLFGTHCFGWEAGLFSLKTIALGRLQFDTQYRSEYEYNGQVKISKGDHVLNVHIPSGGKLDINECILSLKRAYDLFPNVRVGGYLPVILINWFLYPPFKDLFPPTGNLIKFINLFDITESADYEGFRIAHRIFNTRDVSNVDNLPQKSSLQKAFVNYMKQNKPCGYGVGFLLFDGKTIVTQK